MSVDNASFTKGDKNDREIYCIPEPESKTNLVNECSQLNVISEVVVYNSKYAWRIRNFNPEAIETIDSPIFTTGDQVSLKWKMILDDVTNDNPKRRLLRIQVNLLNEREVKAQYLFSILNGARTIGRIGSLATMYPTEKGRSAMAIIPIKYLKAHANELLPNNELTILCRINVQLDLPKRRLSVDLARLLESEKFSDVTLVAGGQEFPVHKSVLASRSLVFAAMFEYDMIENNENVVQITDIEPRVLWELLRYIYTERAERIDQISLELFEAADKYALEDLKFICEEVICEKINVDNVIEVLVLADLHSSETLKRNAKEYIKEHAAEVIKTPGYKAIGETYLHLLGEIFVKI